MRLESGCYRLSIRAEARSARNASQPVVGVEIVAQNRIHCGWRDFTADELSGGNAVLDFEVPPGIGAETGTDAPFEFRFLHFLNADLTIMAVELRHLAVGNDPIIRKDEWRLFGRLLPPWLRQLGRCRPLWLELRRPDSIRLTWLTLHRVRLWRCEPHLCLPEGLYRLTVVCTAGAIRKPSCPILRLEIVSRDQTSIAAHDLRAEDLVAEQGEFDFEVPRQFGIESGENNWFDLNISHFGNAILAIRAINVRRLPDGRDRRQAEALRRTTATRSARANVVIVGNCQAGLIDELFRTSDLLAHRFRTKHHYMELPANLHEQGENDLAECDILLVQDIRDWDRYPLLTRVPYRLPIVRFPCLSFASLWPFDAFNGPDDKEARRRDLPNYEFTYFDGLLGRLRKQIPDPELRFAAYRSLGLERLIDYRRIHTFEERRLANMDAKYGGSIGSFILENFRKRRVFHTTAHPNVEILFMLLRQIAASLGVNERLPRMGPVDELDRLQIPVHPMIARALNVSWADEHTRYAYRGEYITWEAYVRKYIEYYG